MGRNLTGLIQGNENTTKLANQLKAAEKQYPPLTKEEEQAMIKKYKHDRAKLNELLILHNIRAVFNIAKKYKGKTDDFDSMIQNGFLGLAEAASRFELKKKTKFITYAYIWIRKYVLQEFYAKNVEVDRNSTSLNRMIFNHSKDGDTAEFEDYVTQYADPSFSSIEDIDKTLSANEQERICDSLINELKKDTSLSATDKEIFMSLFYHKEKVKDLSEIYEVSVTDIHHIRDKILEKFRTILESKYQIHSYREFV